MKTINEYIIESSSSTIVNKIKKEFKEKEEFFKKHKDDKSVTLDRYPIEFFRFTSRDLQKIK